eukprot:747865-Hanusia_phi.AAC.4
MVARAGKTKQIKVVHPLEMSLRDGGWQDVTGDGGCMKRVLEKGAQGERPAPGDIVRVLYSLSTDEGTIDENLNEDMPFEFELGLEKSDAILGWERVIPLMERGERSEYRFAPEYAFGKAGAPPRVPPNAVVDCKLKLLSFFEPTWKKILNSGNYSSGDEPENEIYSKYAKDLESGSSVQDLDIKQTPLGTEREALTSIQVYEKSDPRLKKLTSRNQRVSGKSQGYTWNENEKIIDVFIDLPAETSSKDVNINLRQNHIRATCKEAVLLEGELNGNVYASDSCWVVTQEDGRDCIHVNMQKQPPSDKIWGRVVKS